MKSPTASMLPHPHTEHLPASTSPSSAPNPTSTLASLAAPIHIVPQRLHYLPRHAFTFPLGRHHHHQSSSAPPQWTCHPARSRVCRPQDTPSLLLRRLLSLLSRFLSMVKDQEKQAVVQGKCGKEPYTGYIERRERSVRGWPGSVSHACHCFMGGKFVVMLNGQLCPTATGADSFAEQRMAPLVVYVDRILAALTLAACSGRTMLGRRK